MNNDPNSKDSSLEIFRSFMRKLPNNVNLSFIVEPILQEVCCKEVLSRECYEHWLGKRKIVALSPEEAFRKVLTAHVRGSWGRKPFNQEEEAAMLLELRKKEIWPCFTSTEHRIGINGFRALGYHESIAANSSIKSSWTARSKKNGKKHISSHEVFMNFAPEINGRSQILSKECFDTWVATRKNGCKKPEFSFRKALIAHLTGKDGRKPFPPHIEKLVLVEVRRKEVWPCFSEKTEQKYKSIGKKGCKQFGFHESQTKPNIARGEEQSGSEDIALPATRSESYEEQMSNNSLTLFEEEERSSKRRRIYLPELYFNYYDDDRILKDVLHYDPLDHLLTSFDLKTSQTSLDNVLAAETPTENLKSTGTADTGLLFDKPFTEVFKYSQSISVLSTFSDVTEIEVTQVLQLKELSQALFKSYYDAVDAKSYGFKVERFSPELSGDIRLLRILRTAKNNVTQAFKDLDSLLRWRLEWDVEKVKYEIVSQNVSIKKLKENLSIGNRGGCFPCFSQDSQGNLTDIFVLQEQDYETLEQCRNDILSHIKLNEFKSIILDKTSRLKRCVVGFKIILDCNKVQSVSKCNWWSVAKHYAGYIKQLTDLYYYWYGGFCKKLHIFGSGYVFKVLFTTIGNSIFDIILNNVQSTYGEPKDHTRILYDMLGESSCWPKFYGGKCDKPDETDTANKKLSKF